MPNLANKARSLGSEKAIAAFPAETEKSARFYTKPVKRLASSFWDDNILTPRDCDGFAGDSGWAGIARRSGDPGMWLLKA
jgi:hypothetical protein